jgi:hypothetical protein
MQISSEKAPCRFRAGPRPRVQLREAIVAARNFRAAISLFRYFERHLQPILQRGQPSSFRNLLGNGQGMK